MEDGATGFGRGKVILLGEHAVIHGVPAIAVGLPRGVTAVARTWSEDLLFLAPFRAAAPDFESEEPISRAFAAALALYPRRPLLRIDVRVELPPGAGLGCSAAIGVSVLDAIDKALGIRRTRSELGTRALAWERIFHGSPSGIDNTTAAIGGLIRFERLHGASTLCSGSPLHLVIVDSAQRADTKEMVEKVTLRLQRKPDDTRRLFEEVRILVGEAELALRRGDASALGDQLDRNHAVLRSLGLSTPRIEALRDAAKGAGALGAKLTGSGGGGCIVVLAEDASHARSIADAMPKGAFLTQVARAA